MNEVHHAAIASSFEELFDGYYFREKPTDQTRLTNVEYFSQHLHSLSDYSETIFVCITPEKRAYVNRRPVSWIDGNKQIKGIENRLGLIVTEHPIEDEKITTPQFIVKDSWVFLLQLTAYLRNQFTGPVVAITGSAGKTSTRLLISHLFREKKVLENRGNHNVRFAIPLYGSKLLSAPDLVNLEISLNALNSYDTGSMSNLVKPTIAIVTSIGEAHLSSLKNTETVALYKSKIFEGLDQTGVALINRDMGEKEFSILLEAAKKHTEIIYTYSLTNQQCDVYVRRMESHREYTEIDVQFFNQRVSYKMQTASEGMIANSLAALLTVWVIKGEIKSVLEKFEDFHSLPKILEKKELNLMDGKTITLIDDSHNASVPAMKNAIDYFHQLQPFYKGNAILVLGQIADLGDTGPSQHEKFRIIIEESTADFIFGYGKLFQPIFQTHEAKSSIQWFETLEELQKAITDKMNEDSLILLKGSVTGSDFYKLGEQLKKSVGR